MVEKFGVGKFLLTSGLESSWLKSSWLKYPGLKDSWLKSLGLKNSWLNSPGLKLWVEKSGVEMFFNQKVIVKRILKGWLQVGVSYFYKMFHFLS